MLELPTGAALAQRCTRPSVIPTTLPTPTNASLTATQPESSAKENALATKSSPATVKESETQSAALITEPIPTPALQNATQPRSIARVNALVILSL